MEAGNATSSSNQEDSGPGFGVVDSSGLSHSQSVHSMS